MGGLSRWPDLPGHGVTWGTGKALRWLMFVKGIAVGGLVAQLCPAFCDPMDYSLQGFSIHAIFQIRVLEWVTISFSLGSSWPRDWTCGSCISCIASRFLTAELLEKPYLLLGLAWLGFIVLTDDRFNLIRQPKKFPKPQLVCCQYILLPRPHPKRDLCRLQKSQFHV